MMLNLLHVNGIEQYPESPGESPIVAGRIELHRLSETGPSTLLLVLEDLDFSQLSVSKGTSWVHQDRSHTVL